MSNTIKKEYFTAFIIELLSSYNDKVSNMHNDLSKLKVLKLLFLWVSKDSAYLNIFDNFVAWDLWPVEKDVYKLINDNAFQGFQIDNNNCRLIWELPTISEEAKLFAKDIVDKINIRNSKLIKMSASTLVDITHKWNCWTLSRAFDLEIIPTSLILSEDGFFN